MDVLRCSKVAISTFPSCSMQRRLKAGAIGSVDTFILHWWPRSDCLNPRGCRREARMRDDVRSIEPFQVVQVG